MPDNTDSTTSYDVVPYPSHPYPQTHPDRLATVAKLFGIAPRPIGQCRVLEVGCGQGGNLLPMAEQLPQSRFVGIDLSDVQIDAAQRQADEAGLTNIELRQLDILDVSADLGEFDYILCHGVYSWIPPHVQDHLLALCAARLSPHGVAYISYNTYPGWHLREMIRSMMRYHARNFPAPDEHVAQARALLDFLAGAVDDNDDVYGPMLRRELNLLRRLSDSYLFHEHLESFNAPIYFHQFAERAAANGLKYLGEAQIAAMYTGNLPPQVERTLRSVATDLVQMEQYMDFVRNRAFRQTLLVHQDVDVDRRLRADRLEELYVSSPLACDESNGVAASSEAIRYSRRDDDRSMSTADSLLKAAIARLATAWPGSVAYSQLVVDADLELRPGVVTSSDHIARTAERLAKFLLKLYMADLVELHSEPDCFVTAVSTCPRAGGVARQQAAGGNVVTNRRHESVKIDDLGRHVLQSLDGARDREALLERLQTLVDDGVLVIRQDAQSPANTRLRLADALDRSLRALADRALLVE
jgi:methyltransferase-like protein/SAM-dependent methyltransferase